MKQIINIFINNPKLEKLRKKYDPNYKKYKTHLTLVYPFEIKDQKKLYDHIFKYTKKIGSFNANFSKIGRSEKDFYLYLLPDLESHQLFMQLHRTLSSNILSFVKNEDLPKYVPHIPIGFFKSEEERETAIREIQKEGINLNLKIEEVHLLNLNPDGSLNSVNTFRF